jgi:hypothetical protein
LLASVNIDEQISRLSDAQRSSLAQTIASSAGVSREVVDAVLSNGHPDAADAVLRSLPADAHRQALHRFLQSGSAATKSSMGDDKGRKNCREVLLLLVWTTCNAGDTSAHEFWIIPKALRFLCEGVYDPEPEHAQMCRLVLRRVASTAVGPYAPSLLASFVATIQSESWQVRQLGAW